MSLNSVQLIVGLSLCLEYVNAIPEEGLDDDLVVLDLLVFRFIFTVGKK